MEDNCDVCFGACGRCREAVHGADGACRAAGQIFHSKCFTCSSCCKMLTGEPFYTISGKIYCEDDFLYSGVHPKLEVCSSCGHLISDNVLQACGTSYHPSCFRCVVCGQSLEDQPFSVDTDNKKVYCVSDYHRVKAPRCAACKMPILPTEGSTDCIRVVSLNRSFHVECFGSEVDLI
ncbi:LIM domain-containing protein 1-like [Eucyclogobius newberryi]|uniref:LIM domain-containing protein 1-like n=1 Tax=Eucyclogobius newberryi TaxID=166745 RepID=UPI003B59554C